MKLSVKAFALACSLIWGAALLLVGLTHAVSPAYGQAFLSGLASVYPGFPTGAGVGSAIVDMFYGLVDGAIAGWLLATIYNAATVLR